MCCINSTIVLEFITYSWNSDSQVHNDSGFDTGPQWITANHIN